MIKWFRVGIVYKITNKLNGMAYIGQTVKPRLVRWAEHVKAAGNGSEFVIHRAIRKYGPETFRVRVLKRVTEPLLYAAEIHFIARHDTFNNGYNMTKGGEGVTMTPAIRRKIGAFWRGKKKPVEQVARTAAKNRGQKRSVDFCTLMSEITRIVPWQRELMVAGLRKHFNLLTLDERVEWRKRHQAHKHTKAAKRMMSIIAKERWQDESYRRPMLDMLSEMHARPTSDETRKRQSNAQLRRFAKLSERRKLSRSHTGKKQSPDLVVRRTAAVKAFYRDHPEAARQRAAQLRSAAPIKHTIATRIKLRLSHLGKPWSAKRRAVYDASKVVV